MVNKQGSGTDAILLLSVHLLLVSACLMMLKAIYDLSIYAFD
eukprot:gene2399-53776_t